MIPSELFWRGFPLMPWSEFAADPIASYKRWFVVENVDDLRLLRSIHQIIGDGFAKGYDLSTHRRLIQAAYRNCGLPPPQLDQLDSLLIRSIVGCQQGVRYRGTVGNPASLQLIPYLKLCPTRERTTEHRALYELPFSVRHPVWEDWWPPCDPECTCIVGTINARRAQREGLLGPEPKGPPPTIRPDPRWRGPMISSWTGD
jgi:hypothetical protein